MSITNSYFSGAGGVSSSAFAAASSSSGGLVGEGSIVSITNSYFSGEGVISASSSSGGLVGYGLSIVVITNSYWNTNALQSVGSSAQTLQRARGDVAMNPSGATGLTLMQLKATSMSTTSAPSPSGLPHSATDNTKAWDLGTASQLPAIKACINPMIVPPTTTGGAVTITCTSYDALLVGQR